MPTWFFPGILIASNIRMYDLLFYTVKHSRSTTFDRFYGCIVNLRSGSLEYEMTKTRKDKVCKISDQTKCYNCDKFTSAMPSSDHAHQWNLVKVRSAHNREHDKLSNRQDPDNKQTNGWTGSQTDKLKVVYQPQVRCLHRNLSNRIHNADMELQT